VTALDRLAFAVLIVGVAMCASVMFATPASSVEGWPFAIYAIVCVHQHRLQCQREAQAELAQSLPIARVL